MLRCTQDVFKWVYVEVLFFCFFQCLFGLYIGSQNKISLDQNVCGHVLHLMRCCLHYCPQGRYRGKYAIQHWWVALYYFFFPAFEFQLLLTAVNMDWLEENNQWGPLQPRLRRWSQHKLLEVSGCCWAHKVTPDSDTQTHTSVWTLVFSSNRLEKRREKGTEQRSSSFNHATSINLRII